VTINGTDVEQRNEDCDHVGNEPRLTDRYATLRADRLDIAFVAMYAAVLGGYLAEHIRGTRLIESEGVESVAFEAGDIAPPRSSIEVSLTGMRHMTAPQRRLVTVMMTDIVGSTAIASTVGDTCWREMIHDHDTVIRRAIAHFRGDEIVHTGDGIVVGFDSPTRAVLCARHVSDALSEMGLKVRIGLHAGEIEVGPDGTTGLAMHLASRVMSVATAGGIVVSRTVRDLMFGSDIAFEDLGQHHLKGVPEPWALYRVAGDQVRTHPEPGPDAAPTPSPTPLHQLERLPTRGTPVPTIAQLVTDAKKRTDNLDPATVAAEKASSKILPIDLRDLESVAAHIDRHGMAAVDSAIAALVEHARHIGANPVLVSVLADPDEPEIARARAFGMLAMHVAWHAP
jgi:class 3 adenylate cyclase